MKIKKKILKNIIIQRILAFMVALYILLVRITSKINHINLPIPQSFWENNKPFILAFWHNQLMMISFSWKAKKKLNILKILELIVKKPYELKKFPKLIMNYRKSMNSLREIFRNFTL